MQQDHPMALDFLRRDIKNLVNFFERWVSGICGIHGQQLIVYMSGEFLIFLEIYQERPQGTRIEINV